MIFVIMHKPGAGNVFTCLGLY